MSSVHRPIRRLTCAILLILAGEASAQPLCDVILRPAFHYTVDGMSISLADSSRSFGVGTDALWTFGDGSIASTSPQHEFTQPGSYTVCLTLTATEGEFCTSSYCREVVVPGQPCPPSQDPYFESEPSGTNALSFQFAVGTTLSGTWNWDFGDGTTSSDPYPLHTWALPGPHFVTLTDHVGDCVATYGRWVEVDGNGSTCGPGLFVDFSPNATSDGVHFEPSIVSSGITALLGIWSFGDGTVDTAFVTHHQFAEPGDYQTCLLVGALTQAGLDTCFSLVCHTFGALPLVSVIEEVGSSLSVWPNPVTGPLHVAMPDPGPAVIRLIDTVGRTVFAERRVMGAVSTIQMNTVAPGRYLLTIEHEAGRSIVRIQVQN